MGGLYLFIIRVRVRSPLSLCVVHVYHVYECACVYVVRWVRAMGIVGITACSRVCHSQR